MRRRSPSTVKFLPCRVATLPADQVVPAAATALVHNPANRPGVEQLLSLVTGLVDPDTVTNPEFLAVLTTKYWGAAGKKLSVSFVETTNAPLRDKILSHMNAWNQFCNITFAWSQSQGEVRISRGQGGYWSYLGTDILHIPQGQQTMNLEGFTLQTPDSEYTRVVRHETGHTLGFPHEHLRAEIVNRLDPQKTIAYFQRTQGWNARMTTEQVLTPISGSSLMATPHAEVDSIMCYQLPADITRDGQPVPGGNDINPDDAAFAAKLYPLAGTPPPPPGGGTLPSTLVALDARGQELGRYHY